MDERTMAKQIAEKVALRGGAVYYVGGCVRDELLGKSTKDVDIEVHGISHEALEDVLDQLGKRLEYGKSFGVYALAGYDMDIALPRTETVTGAGHRDFDVCITPDIDLKKAASRRDFTVNAIMKNVLTGAIEDPFDGRGDLSKKRLRRVSEKTFGEDPLRVLRAAQFAARFGFAVDDETVALCKSMTISGLPKERVFAELQKAMEKSDTPSVFFKVLKQCGKLSDWFPEVQNLSGVRQNPVYHPEGDVWNHTMRTLDAAASLRARAKRPLFFMMAALCHDFGKAVTTTEESGRIRSVCHETAGLPIAAEFLSRISGEKELAAYVFNMMKLHMRPNILAENRSALKVTNKLFDASVEPEDLILLSMADKMGQESTAENEEAFLRERLGEYRALMAKPEVTGKDLIEAGLIPDESFSDILAYAHKLHLAGIEKPSALKQTLIYAKKKE